MRFPSFTPMAAVFLAAAGAASAQMMSPMPMSPRPQADTSFGPNTDFPPNPTRQQRYMAKIVTLRAKTLKITAADGGQLSPEHRASLQKELDTLNREFGIKPDRG
jgi:hypothetical protein